MAADARRGKADHYPAGANVLHYDDEFAFEFGGRTTRGEHRQMQTGA